MMLLHRTSVIVDQNGWRFVYGGFALVLFGALVLIGALALEWNSPRPSRPPDWYAPDLPRGLEAPPDEMLVSLLEDPDGDFVLDATANFAAEMTASSPNATSLDFNGYGLAYRAQDPANYYVFAVGSDGYYTVLQVTDGEMTTLVEWQQFPHIRRGPGPNRLRLRCEGPTCHFYVNDEYATTITDNAWLNGRVGLWIWGAGGQSALARFEEMCIWWYR